MDICTKMEGSAIQGIPFKYRIVSDRFMYENGSFSHPRHSITKQIIQRWIFVPKWQVWPTIAFHSWVFHSNTEQLVMDICTKMVCLAIQGIPSKYRIVSVIFMYEKGRFSHPGHSNTKQIIKQWIYVPKLQVQPSMVFHSITGWLAMDICTKMISSSKFGFISQYRMVSDGYMYQNGRFSHLWFSIPIQDSQR